MAAAARSTWTDSRLDDLKDTVGGTDEKVTRLDKKVDEGFARLDKKVDAGFARLDGRTEEINGRIDTLNHTLVQAMVALISVITLLLSILVAIAATHL